MKSKKQMNSYFELNQLISTGFILPNLKAGVTKQEIEKVLEISLGSPSISNIDSDLYDVFLGNGVVFTMLFDKDNLCVEIKFDVDDNVDADLYIAVRKERIKITGNTSVDELISIFYELNVEWAFDAKRTFFQTVCIQLENGLRFYYAFGKKSDGDYGFFAIKSLLSVVFK